MNPRTSFPARLLLGLAVSVSLLTVRPLEAQKTLPHNLRPLTDDAEDLAYCPVIIPFTFTSQVTGLMYSGWAPRGADGIGKVWYGVNGITDATATMAAWGRFSVYGWQCRIAWLNGQLSPMFTTVILPSNVEVNERPITPLDIACGGTGGSGGGFGDPPPGSGGGVTNRVVPVLVPVLRFDCQGGGSGTTTVAIITVTTCYGYKYYDANGNFLYAEITYCTQFQYMI